MAVRYVTADELSILLKLSPEMIKKLARQGKIPVVRVSPKVLRFDPDAVMAALGDQQEGGARRDRGAGAVTMSNWGASLMLRRVYLAILRKAHPHPVSWDDLRRAQSLPPKVHPNTYGGTMLTLLSEGLANPVEIIPSDRPEAHARRVCTWVCADPAKVDRWLDCYAGLDLPADPQRRLFDDQEGGGL